MIQTSQSYFWFQLFVIALALSAGAPLSQTVAVSKPLGTPIFNKPSDGSNDPTAITSEKNDSKTELSTKQENSTSAGAETFEEVRTVLEEGLQNILGASRYSKLAKASQPGEVTIRLAGVFESNHANLSNEVTPLIKKAVFLLKPYRHLNLKLVGHSSRGEAKSLEISFKRAQSVLNAIKSAAEALDVRLSDTFDSVTISVLDARIFLTESHDSDELSIVDRQVEWVISRGR